MAGIALNMTLEGRHIEECPVTITALRHAVPGMKVGSELETTVKTKKSNQNQKPLQKPRKTNKTQISNYLSKSKIRGFLGFTVILVVKSSNPL